VSGRVVNLKRRSPDVARTLFLGIPLSLLMTTAVLAQETPSAPAARPALTPVKVQIVVSRHLGDQKLSSLPYVLWLTANDRKTTHLRMGVEVPTPTGGGGGFGYRSVGTNIQCSAYSAEGGGFTLNLTLEDSSVHFDSKQNPQASTRIDAPAFRTFHANFSILLRDGQTAQYTSAVDPVSGESMKVDATLNVLK
jgi:hypothetical protein